MLVMGDRAPDSSMGGRAGSSGDAAPIDVDEGEAEEVAEHGRRQVAKMNSPKLPSRAEVEAHNLTHLPFRSWCRHCVRGRGKELSHGRAQRETEVPEFVILIGRSLGRR